MNDHRHQSSGMEREREGKRGNIWRWNTEYLLPHTKRACDMSVDETNRKKGRKEEKRKRGRSAQLVLHVIVISATSFSSYHRPMGHAFDQYPVIFLHYPPSPILRRLPTHPLPESGHFSRIPAFKSCVYPSVTHSSINPSTHFKLTHHFHGRPYMHLHTDRPRHLAIYLDTRRQLNPFTPSLLSYIHALTETASPIYSLTAFLSFQLLPTISSSRHNPDFLSLFANALSSSATSFLPSLNLPICENLLHDDPHYTILRPLGATDEIRFLRKRFGCAHSG